MKKPKTAGVVTAEEIREEIQSKRMKENMVDAGDEGEPDEKPPSTEQMMLEKKRFKFYVEGFRERSDFDVFEQLQFTLDGYLSKINKYIETTENVW